MGGWCDGRGRDLGGMWRVDPFGTDKPDDASGKRHTAAFGSHDLADTGTISRSDRVAGGRREQSAG